MLKDVSYVTLVLYTTTYSSDKNILIDKCNHTVHSKAIGERA